MIEVLTNAIVEIPVTIMTILASWADALANVLIEDLRFIARYLLFTNACAQLFAVDKSIFARWSVIGNALAS